ncbi:MAG TPA: hypothetical protein VMB48_13790 [Steroidobacteraceae bacterium]|nr:hypothetical protein [Steroidobacteraceae bacterium]
MHVSWTTIALQLLNFAILVWLLQRFLYRPALRMIAARQADVARLRAEAAQADARARELVAQLDARRREMDAEREASLKAAAAETDRLRQTRLADANHEADALLAKARAQLAVERRQALEQVQQAALDLATDMAGRLLAGFPEPLRSQAWLERIERQLTALAEGERAALLRDLGRAPLTVVTAAALAPDLAENWRVRLAHALGRDPAIIFEVEPRLRSGAELHFGDTRLGFTLQDALQGLRMELARHADAA